MSKNILIVEGEADCGFFSEICKKSELAVNVKVGAAKDFGADRNSKQAVFNLLRDSILSQLDDADAAIERAAIVVDADTAADGGLGFAGTLQRVSDLLVSKGYSEVEALPAGGYQFQHPDGLKPFGLWIMPDNNSEGMLENWISRCISPDQQQLFNHATTTVTALQNPLFNEIHRTKADVATWLAWQRKPGENLYACITNDLLDNNSALYSGLVTWLKATFPKPEAL